jgi:hypothetical protein
MDAKREEMLMTRIFVGLPLILGALMLGAGPVAASGEQQAHHAVVRYPVDAATTHPLRQVPELPDVVHDVRKLERKMLPNRLGSADNPENDTVLQGASGGPSTATTGASFDGLGNRNGVLPPDTVGDIGPNHYVLMTNLSFAIYDRSGNTLYGPVNNNTLWSPLGGPCAANNDGDPVVLYDQGADRWLMSQFALPSFPNGPFYQCIAVSQTGDPTGAWNLYAYLVSDTKLNDYAKFGVWTDGYYMAMNQFKCNVFSCSWQGQGVVAFERDKMLSGDPSARMVLFDLYSTDPNLGGMLPADWDGATPPPAGAPNTYAQFDDNSWGYSPDQVQLWSFHVDWSNTANSTFGLATKVQTAAFDSNMCSYARNCIAQPGGTNVDAVSDRLMFRLQYRNFGNDQSPDEALVANHTVDVGGDHAGVRWYELRNTGSGWGIRQQGTYAPDSDNRWMGSAAMNGAGDIALGYSVSSTGTYPSIRFTGHLNGDPLGQMTQGEGSIVDGGGSQSHSSGRWGDYSAMSVDPTDDCTFWYTQEYYASNSSAGWHTRIGSFKLADCGAVDIPPGVTLTSPADGATVSGSVALTATANDDQGVSQVDFSVDCGVVGSVSSVGNEWSTSWDTAGCPEGLQTVAAVATDTGGQTGSDSNTVTVDNVPEPTVHVVDLDGSSADAARNRWNASVTATIRGNNDATVSDATVSGSWSDGATGGASCTTDGTGQCTLTKSNLKGNVTSITFTVTDVSASGAYNPADNTDPDGDSDGTTVVVCRGGCTAPPPPPSGPVHIGDLDGSTSTGRGGKWNAGVTITAHDASENVASGVTVTGDWRGAASGSGSCTTDASGECSVGKNNLRGMDATFQVTDILDALGNSIYDGLANHDPDGDSDGTSITLMTP